MRGLWRERFMGLLMGRDGGIWAMVELAGMGAAAAIIVRFLLDGGSCMLGERRSREDGKQEGLEDLCLKLVSYPMKVQCSTK